MARHGTVEVNRRTLIDARLVEAEGTVSERAAEAGWTKKNGPFGYKAHIAVDEDSGIIRQAVLTSADLHDSQVATPLIQGDKEAVSADKAYGAQARRDDLEQAGLKMYKAASL